MEIISDPQVIGKLNNQALPILILFLRDNPLRAVQHCKFAKDMWDRLQEKYEENSVISGTSFINKVLNMGFKREWNMDDHVATLEWQFARLAFKNTEFEDATKIGIMMSTLRDNNELEPFITSVSLMKEDSHLW